MAKPLQKDGIDTLDVVVPASALRLPDSSSALENAMNVALDYCAEKMRLEGSNKVLERLKRGDGAARAYFHYSLAQQAAEALGALDENIKSVSIFDYDATPDDVSFATDSQALPIHLLVWTKRKTSALNALVAAMDRTLARDYAQVVGAPWPAHLLDVQFVDDADVEKRTGFASLLSSIFNRPICVWQR